MGSGNMIENIEADYSGYYCCDEQFIKLNGKRNYRLTLYGHILNIAVTERIAPDRGYETIMKFLQNTAENKPFYALTTDNLSIYKMNQVLYINNASFIC